MIKVSIKVNEIEPVTSWEIDITADALKEALEELQQNPTHEAALKYSDLYNTIKQFDYLIISAVDKFKITKSDATSFVLECLIILQEEINKEEYDWS